MRVTHGSCNEMSAPILCAHGTTACVPGILVPFQVVLDACACEYNALICVRVWEDRREWGHNHGIKCLENKTIQQQL